MMNTYPILFLRGFIFSSFLIIFTLIYATISLFTFILPHKFRYKFITFWSRIIIWMAKVVCGVKYKIRGIENIPDEGCIVLSNHQSTWETLAFQFIFPPQSWILKKELLNIPFFGWALRLLEPIAINRNNTSSAMEQLLDQGQKRLDAGRWIVIFPEGTRVKPGVHKPFKKGGAVLAEKTGHLVVPVAHNAGKFWPRRSFIKTPGTVEVVIGKPIKTKGKSFKEINEAARAWIDKTKETL